MSKSADPRAAYLDPDVIGRIKTLELFARGAVEGTRIGMHRSTLHGLSTEFSRHRPYTAGDETRRVDWKVYSRTNRYYIKQYEAETNFDTYMLFDASSSMHYGSGRQSGGGGAGRKLPGSQSMSKLEYAKHMAAVLAYLIVQQGDSVGLAVFDGELRDYVRPRGKLSVIGDISEMLSGTEGRPRTNVGGIMDEFASRIRRRGFVILFSDLFDNEDEFIGGLNHLHFTGQHVIIFQVLDRDELTFSFDGVVRFEGLEGEDALRVQPDRLRVDYLAALEELILKIRESCEAINADYVLVDTSRPVQDVLIEYLNARKTLRWKG